MAMHTHLPEHNPGSATHLVSCWLSPDGHSSHPTQTTECKLLGTKHSKGCQQRSSCLEAFTQLQPWEGLRERPVGWEGCTTTAHSPAGGSRR